MNLIETEACACASFNIPLSTNDIVISWANHNYLFDISSWMYRERENFNKHESSFQMYSFGLEAVSMIGFIPICYLMLSDWNRIYWQKGDLRKWITNFNYRCRWLNFCPCWEDRISSTQMNIALYNGFIRVRNMSCVLNSLQQFSQHSIENLATVLVLFILEYALFYYSGVKLLFV